MLTDLYLVLAKEKPGYAWARQLVRPCYEHGMKAFFSASIPCFVHCNQENPNEFNSMSLVRCEMIIMIRMSPICCA